MLQYDSDLPEVPITIRYKGSAGRHYETTHTIKLTLGGKELIVQLEQR